MACLAGHRRDFPEATEWIEKALKTKTNLTDAHSLRGQLFTLHARQHLKMQVSTVLADHTTIPVVLRQEFTVVP